MTAMVAPHTRPKARPKTRPGRRATGSPAQWLAESEQLFRDFRALTPYRYKPFVKMFKSFDAYEQWKRAQTNPWYR